MIREHQQEKKKSGGLDARISGYPSLQVPLVPAASKAWTEKKSVDDVDEVDYEFLPLSNYRLVWLAKPGSATESINFIHF